MNINITEEQIKKIFELASLEERLKKDEDITSNDITEALIRIERKVYSFSGDIKNENMKNRKILIADDLELSIYQLSTVLKKIGIIPRVARNKEEAISELQKAHFDCVIVDLFIPDSSDGLELIQYAEKRRKESGDKTKIVVISGTDDESLINKAYECGIDFYIQKDNVWHNKLLKFLSSSLQTDTNVAYTKYVIDSNIVSYVIKKFNDSKTFDSLIQSVNSSMYMGVNNVIFDLNEITTFDSDNAYIFADIYKICAEHGGKFILINPSMFIKEALTFAYLEDVIIYAKNIEDAVLILKKESNPQ